MRRFPTALFFALCLAAASGCSDDTAANSGNGGSDSGGPDASDAGGDGGVVDQGGPDTGGPDTGGQDLGRPDQTTQTDTGPVAWETCVPHPLGEERCDDGFDDDCDGLIDEGCGCGVSTNTQHCYPGNPAELDFPDTGCQAGTQACTLEFWGECSGAVGPADDDACDDGVDNDCDGEVDEGCVTDPPVATCPADFAGPVLRDYTLSGSYSDPNGTPLAVGFWSQLEAPPGHSRDITASGLELTFFADVAGDYFFELTVENTEGLRDTCQTRFTALTDDVVRIEMFWNPDYEGPPADTSDVDLLLRRNLTAGYRYYGTSDTCYWSNCATCNEPYDDDAGREVECRDFLAQEPPPGWPENDPWPAPQLAWSPGGVETNPRLDLDDVEGQGPENINIRRPNAGTYRVAVHYYDADSWTSGGGSTVSAFVRILCAGEEIYPDEDRDGVPLVVRGQRSDFRANDIWEVGDLIISYDGETPQCAFNEFGDADCHRICELDTADDGGCPAASCE